MDKIVGNKIRNLRKEKGLTQEQLADMLHISQSSFARIENGENSSWANYLTKICEVFEVEPEELVRLDTIVINQNQKGGESNNAFIINQLSEKLIEQFEQRIKEKEELISNLREQLRKK